MGAAARKGFADNLRCGLALLGFRIKHISHFAADIACVSLGKYLKGSSVEMKFVYQKGYPTSFFHDDGPAGVTVFTRQ